MAYFAVSIFISAFLLFQIQPMIARIILPWFGGSSAVWSTVQMFFQVLLTGGYAYANWLTSRIRRREVVHLVMLGLSLAMIFVLGLTWKSPITPDAGWKPSEGGIPIWEICELLSIAVGLPYFLLSTNSPLMQAWFHRKFPEKTAYRLYALSNTGSLLGLVTYPVLIEPYLTLAWQGRLWSMVYVVYAGFATYGTVKSLLMKSDSDPGQVAIEKIAGHRPAIKEIILWIALAATASILLLATTSHITQEVAAIPFLWVLPLTIYLLTFILAFSGERWYSRQVFLVLFFAATVLYAWVLTQSGTMNILLQVVSFTGVLFVACMVCHGELYRLRPHPMYLTLFYLIVSVGGATGGILINFVAPIIFKGFWELPLGYVICWVLFLIMVLRDKRRPVSNLIFIGNTVLLLSAVCISCARAVEYIRADFTDALGSWRNFYGVVRVRQFGVSGSASSSYVLVHGITIHGIQYLDPKKRDLPTTYYGSTSGVGLAILNHPRYGESMRLGGMGLGIGTISAYGQPGDVYRFYEINPQVIRLAEGEDGYFSYLRDSQATIDVIPGDARLSLESELAAGQPQNYDVLVLDVFSSDSIPVHLLDVEAFELYLEHLAGDGILAINITNRYLDLVPVVWTLADHFHLSRVLIEDPGNSAEIYPSIWMLIARNPVLLANPKILSRTTPMDHYASHIGLWTDNFSNVFKILKH